MSSLIVFNSSSLLIPLPFHSITAFILQTTIIHIFPIQYIEPAMIFTVCDMSFHFGFVRLTSRRVFLSICHYKLFAYLFLHITSRDTMMTMKKKKKNKKKMKKQTKSDRIVDVSPFSAFTTATRKQTSLFHSFRGYGEMFYYVSAK